MDAATFLHHLERSKLLPAAKLKEVMQTVPRTSGTEIADALVASLILTPFQARQLLAGNAKGFLLGGYLIFDQIGSGGMGVVYRAVHRAMRRPAALKVFKPRSTAGPDQAQLFLREAQAAAQLVHPNIAAIYDAGKSRGVYFLAMEFVEGRNLKQVVECRGPLGIELGCAVAQQTALALQFAHARGVVHRDIKPSNLLLNVRSEWNPLEPPDPLAPELPPVVKVLDFGLARIPNTNPLLSPQEATIPVQPGAVCGTLDFAAPEQLQDIHATDARSDLYSLGSTLYYLLGGQPPFGGETAIAKLIRRATEPPEPLSNLRSNLPPGLIEVVRRLMAPAPGDRFQTATEVVQALSRWCDPLAGGSETSDSEIPTVQDLTLKVPEDDTIRTEPPPPSNPFLDLTPLPPIKGIPRPR
jgi:serine/threonine-protein kinase